MMVLAQRVAAAALALVVGAWWSAEPALAQDNGAPVTIGTWRTIESEILGEQRRLIIGLPAGYESSQEAYPVLYLLDGPGHFHHTTGLTSFLAEQDIAPAMIVVAVGNTNRTRDMAPPTRAADDPMAAGAGGADEFIAFFRDELIPYIDAEYRTHPYRVLVGHSLGGLFAIHTLVHEPDVFDAYLAISPSLWWDDQMLVEQADAFFSETRELNRTLYMTMGSEGGGMLGGMRKLEGVLTEHTPRGFEWDSRVMLEETHGSVPYRSTRLGLEFIFRHWGLRNPLPLYELGGVDAINSFFEAAGRRYGMERETPVMVFGELSWVLMQSGRLDEARAVLDHDPDTFEPPAMLYTMLARACAERGDDAGATSAYTRALELNPLDEFVRARLSERGVDTDAIAPRPSRLSAETLGAYAGAYVSTDGDRSMTIDVVEGGLRLEGGGMPGLTVKALEPDRFIADGQPFEIVFERDGDGRVTGFAVRIGAQELGRARRTGDRDPE